MRTGVDQLSRGSFSAVGSGAPSSARAVARSCCRCSFLSFLAFSAVALGTLKAIIRFAHQQSPGDFELRPRATFVNTRLDAASDNFLDQ